MNNEEHYTEIDLTALLKALWRHIWLIAASVIGFNNRYLMDALRYAPADKVKMQLNTGISPCIITPVDGGDEFLYMVLPVRLKAQ